MYKDVRTNWKIQLDEKLRDRMKKASQKRFGRQRMLRPYIEEVLRRHLDENGF